MSDNAVNFIQNYLMEVKKIAIDLSIKHYIKIDNIVEVLIDTREKSGRVFVMGFGGSAANASHFVNDLRKLCDIEAYCPTDNVAEFSARVNDESPVYIFEKWLKTSNLGNNDCLFILSVGGGCLTASPALMKAIDYAHEPDIDAMVLGICGKQHGYLAVHGDYVVVVPEENPSRVTPHTEEFQSVLCHCIITHPQLAINKTVW